MRKLFLAIILLISLGISAQDVYVAKYYGNRQAAISYTFDDGLLEHFTMVFPKFQELGMKGTFGIIGSRVGKDHKGTPCMTWEQIKAMSDAGHEITNHGWRHQSIEKLSGEALRYEVQHNDTFIYNKVGVFPRSYFYPGNRKTEEGLALCSKDRVGTYTRTAESHPRATGRHPRPCHRSRHPLQRQLLTAIEHTSSIKSRDFFNN